MLLHWKCFKIDDNYFTEHFGILYSGKPRSVTLWQSMALQATLHMKTDPELSNIQMNKNTCCPYLSVVLSRYFI